MCEISHLWVYSPNVCNDQGWAELLLQDRNAIHVSPMDGKNLITWIFTRASEDLQWKDTGVRHQTQVLCNTCRHCNYYTKHSLPEFRFDSLTPIGFCTNKYNKGIRLLFWSAGLLWSQQCCWYDGKTVVRETWPWEAKPAVWVTFLFLLLICSHSPWLNQVTFPKPNEKKKFPHDKLKNKIPKKYIHKVKFQLQLNLWIHREWILLF